jgi:hypothetical protein
VEFAPLAKHRGTLTIVAAVVLSIVSVAAGLQVHSWLYGLPELATADRDGLLRWLVLADLNDHDDATCRVLVNRLEAEFVGNNAADADFNDAAKELSHSQRERIAANTKRLEEVWFHARVDEYLALKQDRQRTAFLDHQIRTIFRCAEIDQQFGRNGDNEDAGGRDFVGGFFDSLAGWQASAPPFKQSQIASAVKEGLIRWLVIDDLSAQSPAMRRQIVAGLEKELGENLSFQAKNSLNNEEQDNFWRNVNLLAEAWFHMKAEQFAALPKAERRAFVEKQMTVVAELAAHSPGSQQGGPLGIAAKLQGWIASIDEPNRQPAREFASALQSAFIARIFSGAAS